MYITKNTTFFDLMHVTRGKAYRITYYIYLCGRCKEFFEYVQKHWEGQDVNLLTLNRWIIANKDIIFDIADVEPLRGV